MRRAEEWKNGQGDTGKGTVGQKAVRDALVRLAAAAVAVEVCAAKLEFEGEGGKALDEPPARVVCKEREATASELPENECQ